jgi:hypothetical protein
MVSAPMRLGKMGRKALPFLPNPALSQGGSSSGVADDARRGTQAGAAAAGERMIPYGYRLTEDGVTLADAPEEQATVALVHEMRERGYSARRIGGELLRLGIRPRSGTHWHPKVVIDLCRREPTAAASPPAC